MEKLIQYATKASYYDGIFGGGEGWTAAGMGYLIVTRSGSLIAVDGGLPEDAEDFAELLFKNSEGNTAEVDLWVITHPHIDHYGVLRGITESESLKSRVKVKRILCLFPEEFAEIEEDPYVRNGIDMLKNALSVTNAELITPAVGDVIDADGAEIRILSTPEFTADYNTPNYLSLIFSVTLGEKKVLFTGDATRGRLCSAVKALGDKLKSDILQLPHHGLCDTGDVDFYNAVGAETLLVPICIAGERSMKSGYYGEATAANEYAEEIAVHIYRAYEGTKEIPIYQP